MRAISKAVVLRIRKLPLVLPPRLRNQDFGKTAIRLKSRGGLTSIRVVGKRIDDAT